MSNIIKTNSDVYNHSNSANIHEDRTELTTLVPRLNPDNDDFSRLPDLLIHSFTGQIMKWFQTIYDERGAELSSHSQNRRERQADCMPRQSGYGQNNLDDCRHSRPV